MLNFLNSIAVRMLGASSLAKDYGEEYAWIDSVVNAVNNFLVPLFILVMTAGSIYAVVLGINLARAETAEKREEAKKRMIWAIIGVASIIVLIIISQSLPSIFETIIKPKSK